ncbi:hypothetical protein SmJEL517_g01285 [Synchytrium microbalum]|uniref:Enhancer of mRNA-decapping protein 3 n=1 Tax=Synchytrium microbalum TaxID=1806994 RepID=A0A507CBM6_9FUNG|nr:uncharacterized protein SmJEL517_g01285 [Synchytrium microbalum]TPX36738.1 hypothetical protein SmJEL517_g01285 [Synchytrium microbalum]
MYPYRKFVILVTLDFKGQLRELGPQTVSAKKIVNLEFMEAQPSASSPAQPTTQPKSIKTTERAILKREQAPVATPPKPVIPLNDEEIEEVEFEEYQSPPAQRVPEPKQEERKAPPKIVPQSRQSNGQNSDRLATPQSKSKRDQASNTTPRVSHSRGYEKDFDFQASLELFDKKQIFDEIRQSDDTDPDSLLVTLNKVKKNDAQRKLGIRENVLDTLFIADEKPDSSSVEAGQDDADDEGFQDPYRRRRTSKTSMSRKTSVTFERPQFRTPSNIVVPSLTPTEFQLLESIAMNEVGPSFEQMVENGGRDVAQACLQALGGSRRFLARNHNPPPHLVVLCGNSTRVGAYGLAAARHLANHECRVDVLVLGSETDVTNNVAMQMKMLLHTGATLINSLPLQSVPDMVIDALLGADMAPSDIPDLLSRTSFEEAISWVCGLSRTPYVCSLELPTGLGGVASVDSNESVPARWTIGFGVPTSLLGSRAQYGQVGEVLLADIGFPKAAFTRFVKKAKLGDDSVKYIPPFSDKFMVGIELVS